MANHHRGEISALFDDRPYTLVLTLGALAELESAFGNDDMLALAERFRTGRISSRDAKRVIGAGLRGAGHDITDDAVGRMTTANGAAGYVDIVARLLAATFGGPIAQIAAAAATGTANAASSAPSNTSIPEAGSAQPVPFPGAT